MGTVGPVDVFEVYDEFRSNLLAGAYLAEEVIDGTSLSLACTNDLVRQALEMLRDEGLVSESRPGVFAVAEARARSARRASFRADYADQGRSPTVRTLSLDIVSTEEVQDEVRSLCQAEQLVIRHHSIQSVDGVPHAIAESYVPYELLGSQYRNLRDGKEDVYDILNRLGKQPSHKRESLWVDTPSVEERKGLQLQNLPGVRVVRLSCAVWDHDVLLEVCRLTDRADLYEFIYDVSFPP